MLQILPVVTLFGVCVANLGVTYNVQKYFVRIISQKNINILSINKYFEKHLRRTLEEKYI